MNPSGPEIDWFLTSPYTSPLNQTLRHKKEGNPDQLKKPLIVKFSLSAPWEMYREQ